ncbi:hypothetical protein ACS0TY_000092 [Phlomoides rotata]
MKLPRVHLICLTIGGKVREIGRLLRKLIQEYSVLGQWSWAWNCFLISCNIGPIFFNPDPFESIVIAKRPASLGRRFCFQIIPIAKRSALPRTHFYRARVHSDSRFSIPFSPAQFDSPLSFPKFRICRNRGSLIRSEVGRGHGLKICVLVRVLRTWEARNFKCNKDLMSVDFLLLDEKDCLIQGSIHHQLLYKFRDNLREEGIFLIRDFEVFRSGIHYKITDHDYMIRFTDATTLEETVEENFLIPSEKFHLHSHSDLLSLMDKIDVLPDIMFILKLKMVRAKTMIQMNIVFLKYYPSSPMKKSKLRLEVEVDDGRDCTMFVIFDKDAKQLTKSTTAELMAKNDTVQNGRDRAPTSVLNIVGKTYKFQVKVTPYNFRAKYQSFTVSRIMNITDPATEEHLQKKISVIEEAESSSNPTLGKIKIEGVGEEKKTGKGSKVSVKRRKV